MGILRHEIGERLRQPRRPLRHQRVHCQPAIDAPLHKHLAQKFPRQLVSHAGERRRQTSLVADFLHDALKECIAFGLLQDRLTILIERGHGRDRAATAIARVACIAIERRERAGDRLLPCRHRHPLGRGQPAKCRHECFPLRVIERIAGHPGGRCSGG